MIPALPPVFAALTAGSVLAYVLMDGWDLGVGILYPLVARRADALALFESIAPFRGANETWLVLGGMMLLAGLHLAYATLLPRIYSPLFIMLVSLLLRGVGYEFQGHGGMLERLWEWIFALASMAVALCQGWILGLTVEGIEPRAGAGGTLEMIGRQLFPLACGVGVLGGYALLGSCWLIAKTRGALQVFGREVGLSALALTGVLLLAISVWMSLASPHVARRWLTPNPFAVSWVLPAAAVLFGWRLKQSLWGGREARPLLWAILLFMAAFAGVAVSIYPFILPYRHTVFEAAHDGGTAWFAGIGVIIVILLLTIFYLSLAYRAFRGEVLQTKDDAIAPAPHIGARRTSGQRTDLHLS